MKVSSGQLMIVRMKEGCLRPCVDKLKNAKHFFTELIILKNEITLIPHL